MERPKTEVSCKILRKGNTSRLNSKAWYPQTDNCGLGDSRHKLGIYCDILQNTSYQVRLSSASVYVRFDAAAKANASSLNPGTNVMAQFL